VRPAAPPNRRFGDGQRATAMRLGLVEVAVCEGERAKARERERGMLRETGPP
jgi:hypothetical protein